MSSDPLDSEPAELIVGELIGSVAEHEISIEKPSETSAREDTTAVEDPTFCDETGAEESMQTEESPGEASDSAEDKKGGFRAKRKYRRGATFDPNILGILQAQQRSGKSRRYAQKYRKQWEEVFHWCRPSKKGELLFYCTLCRQDYFGGISELTRHAVTKKHEKNVHLDSAFAKFGSSITGPGGRIECQTMSGGVRSESTFRDSDLEQSTTYARKWEKKFKWLAPSDKGDEHYYCKVCQRHYSGGLKQITLHCTTRAHLNALVATTKEAEVYFMESQPAGSRKPSASPNKRRISESQEQSGNDSDQPSPENASTSKKTEVIVVRKAFLSPSGGKKVVLGMERRLEPLHKPKPTKVVRQVAPYSRNRETQAAVKTIERAETGALIEEEVGPIAVKTEGGTHRMAIPLNDHLAQMPVVERRAEADAYDVFGKHVANKLRSLTSEQNKFAQKLIMDVLFEGEMDSLDRNTKVLKCGVSCVCQQ